MFRYLLLFLASVFLLVAPAVAKDFAKLPNILIIYADDLGYGDLSCYNPESAYETPRLDLMAAEGIRFTDAHSPIHDLFAIPVWSSFRSADLPIYRTRGWCL